MLWRAAFLGQAASFPSEDLLPATSAKLLLFLLVWKISNLPHALACLQEDKERENTYWKPFGGRDLHLPSTFCGPFHYTLATVSANRHICGPERGPFPTVLANASFRPVNDFAFISWTLSVFVQYMQFLGLWGQNARNSDPDRALWRELWEKRGVLEDCPRHNGSGEHNKPRGSTIYHVRFSGTACGGGGKKWAILCSDGVDLAVVRTLRMWGHSVPPFYSFGSTLWASLFLHILNGRRQ